MKNENNLRFNLHLALLSLLVLVCFLVMGSFTALAVDEENASQKTSSGNEFPYPRGTAPPYGMMGWETGTQFSKDKATLVHFGWRVSITPEQFVDNINKG